MAGADEQNGEQGSGEGRNGERRSPVMLVAGFLGSGKTTLILSLARYVTERGLRVAILVNEAGDIAMDAGLLASDGHRVREIFGGCVCCSLVGDLRGAVAAVAGYGPDILILEPSGMAEVDRLRDLVREEECVDSVRTVGVVDVPRLGLLRRAAGKLIENGVRSADVVLLNKADRADGEALSAAREYVASFEERREIPVFEVSGALGVPDEVWRPVLRAAATWDADVGDAGVQDAGVCDGDCD